MRVRILFFGVLRDVFSEQESVLELSDGATVKDVLARYGGQRPELAALWPSLAVAVNQRYAAQDLLLAEGDELALLPPVSGGSLWGGAGVRAQLTREVIQADEITAALKQGGDGAIVVFDGIVRNNTRGRRTRFLDYEAYEAMALTQMQQLLVEATERYGIREAALVHRLGRLEVGETSVLIVVASAHRGAAFDAARWIIDTLKTTVPIWKKEFFIDGAVWADGEPFPEELRPGVPGSDGREENGS